MSQHKTIVYIHPHFTLPGGAGKVVLETATRLQNRGHRIVIVCGQVYEEYRHQYPDLTFRSINCPLSSSFFFWIFFSYWQSRIHRILDEYPKAILFPQVFPANWWAFNYRKKHRQMPCVWFCQEPSAFIHIQSWIRGIHNPIKRLAAYILGPIFSTIDKRLATQADQIIANSNYSKNIIEGIYKQSVQKVIYPGIEPIEEPKSTILKEHYILTVSRLTKFKNIDYIIQAFSTIARSNLRLKIVGQGEELGRLKALSENLGVYSKIDFLLTPTDSELKNLYIRAKMLVIASINEPFGLVPIEAMSNGTAVIADHSGGPLETINDNRTGLFFSFSERNDLKNKILYLLTNRRYVQFGQNARTWVNSKFTWNKTTDQLDKLFISI